MKKTVNKRSKSKTKKTVATKKSGLALSTKKKKKPLNSSIIFSIKNVRCFAERQDLKIKPLTFLTGENSTGKTTILGCFRATNRLMRGSETPDFNREPYQMGMFNDIIRKTKGMANNKVFEIGFSSEELKTKCFISFIKKEKKEEASVNSLKIKTEDSDGFEFDYVGARFVLFFKGKKLVTPFKDIPILDVMSRFGFLFLSIGRFKMTISDRGKTISADLKQALEKLPLEKIYQFLDLFKRFSVNMAPIRAKPERTYNPIEERLHPEEKEIPMILMLLNAHEDKKWKKLYKSLLHFGKASGLFSDITVKRFDKSTSGPFQLQFDIRGNKTNIIDTGYGISQILPLLVHIFRAPEECKFMLQQPEVHLHPTAQAELSSLLIQSIKNQNHSFIVETHSDYMVDRARIEIQKGSISPDDVSLIYLEALKEGAVKAHNISFDKQGNILGAPSGYRKFFLKETNRLLGFES